MLFCVQKFKHYLHEYCFETNHLLQEIYFFRRITSKDELLDVQLFVKLAYLDLLTEFEVRQFCCIVIGLPLVITANAETLKVKVENLSEKYLEIFNLAWKSQIIHRKSVRGTRKRDKSTC